MPLYASRSVIAVGVLAAVALLPACQSYRSKPLDPAAHDQSWRARTPADEPVRAFVERLAESGDADAASFDPHDGLSLSEAELVAIVFNPDLRLARLRLGVARATAEHAGRWDDPEFAIDVLHITESVSNPWVITPALAFTIPISGRLEVEKARADAAVAAELERVAEQEWRTRFDLRRAWLDWSAARLRLDETESLITSMDALVASTERLADAGELIRTEASLFEIERMQRRHEHRRLQGDVAAAEQKLRSLMGLSPEAPVELQPTLDIAAPTELTDGALVDRNPSLSRLREEYEVTEQTLRREIRKQYPDLTIGPMYESDQGQSRIGFLGAIPLPILNANRQGIAEAEAERTLARAAFESAYETLVGEIAGARARADALRDEQSQIVEQMVPLVDRQLADARRLLELGEGGGLVLLESLVRAHETKLHLIDVRLDEASTTAELAYLAGPAITTNDTSAHADEVTP